MATAATGTRLTNGLPPHWPNWRPEVLRALDKGNLVLAREEGRPDGDIAAFCAFEVNRSGFLGPVAVRPDLLGKGRGRPVLVGALHERVGAIATCRWCGWGRSAPTRRWGAR